MHGAAQVRLGSFQRQVIGIAHQHVGMGSQPQNARPAVSTTPENENGIIAEDVLAFIASGGDVIAATRQLDAERAGHGCETISRKRYSSSFHLSNGKI
jgi:hypothetical protein